MSGIAYYFLVDHYSTSWLQRCSDALPALETFVATVIAHRLSCLEFRDSSAFLFGGLRQQQPGGHSAAATAPALLEAAVLRHTMRAVTARIVLKVG